MADIQEFEEFRIGIVSPDRIRAWSNGEVKKPETINYRTLKPERDGLFCEKIFGPTKDWECYCGKYKKVRFKGIICEKCGVEITRARVRRERMGHIELAAPVAHIWYFKGIPSKMGYLLDMSPKDLEKVLYFASHIIIRIDEEKRAANIDALKEELDREIDALNKTADEQIAAAEAEAAERRAEFEVLLKSEDGEDKKAISAAKSENKGVKKDIDSIDKALEKRKKEIEASATHRYQEINGVYAFFKDMKRGQLAEFEDIFSKLFKKRNVNNEQLYWELEDRYGAYFEGGIGAEAVRELLRDIDLDKEQTELKSLIKGDGEKEAAKGQKRQKAIKRLKVVGAFRGSENNPEDMILETVPVIPPDLRPMVPLDGGRYATSDLNDLYRRVINRNNRLKRLLDLGAPKIIVNNEKRMLQEAVDTLFDNGRRGRPITGAGNRPLKSLADLLKGKQGRFRQNLLGKRVDYSGRSVIVVGPSLKFYQCGLPKQIALELFKPFVMKRLVDKGLAPNIKGVKKLVERANPVVWDVLEEVIKDQVVLLNRAPTLHRLGIQAFEPVLVEGKAIQIHPLVCTAFNADFDGDQMAVHLPLSAEAQAEARLLMLSAHNVLSPANGKPIATPTQDMVLGCFYLTEIRAGLKGEGKVFGSPQEAMMAEDFGEIDLRAKVTVRIKGERIETSVGRVIFNSVMPEGFRFVNQVVSKGDISNLVTECVEAYGMKDIVSLLDGIKNLGFKYATRAGTTIALDDIKVPKNKWKILEEPEAAVAKTEQQFRRGLMTEGERHQRVVNIWNDATDKVAKAMEEEFELDPDNPVYLMATSGARGNLKQVRQLAGMRGLVVNPKGDIIDRPIKTNFREGMTVLEYFLSTHGGRKGLADTALRTADAGYLTRRLVDVVQDTIVREEDCGTVEYVTLPVTTSEGDPNEGLLSRIVINDVKEPKGKKVLLAVGEAIRHADLETFVQAGVVEISVRSVVTCATRHGVCQQCYGLSLATGRLVDIGEAVGIIAAQSIGEPGTQLTLRTFHTGGVAAGGDITQGLPRVVELFEARKPKGQAILAEIDGKVTVSIDKEEDEVVVTVTGAKKGSAKAEEKTYKIHSRSILRVADGDVIEHGDRITAGSIYPPDLVTIKDSRATQQYLVDGVQEVYKSQGVDIHDKHIELITRQMLTKVFISAAGDTDFLPGQYVNSYEMAVENKRVVEEGGKEAVFRQVILGITKSSLETDSFLSAASFQETTRILTDAAVAGKSDPLLGLKENVIIGKLIPAGTGLKRYSDVTVMPATDEV